MKPWYQWKRSGEGWRERLWYVTVREILNAIEKKYLIALIDRAVYRYILTPVSNYMEVSESD